MSRMTRMKNKKLKPESPTPKQLAEEKDLMQFCHAKARTLASSLDQRTQDRQIFHILVQIGRFGCLQAAGRITKTVVVDDAAERFATDFAPINPRVAVHSRSQFRF